MYYQNKNAEQVERISDKLSRAGYLRLDLNENPVGFLLNLSGRFWMRSHRNFCPCIRKCRSLQRL